MNLVFSSHALRLRKRLVGYNLRSDLLVERDQKYKKKMRQEIEL